MKSVVAVGFRLWSSKLFIAFRPRQLRSECKDTRIAVLLPMSESILLEKFANGRSQGRTSTIIAELTGSKQRNQAKPSRKPIGEFW